MEAIKSNCIICVFDSFSSFKNCKQIFITHIEQSLCFPQNNAGCTTYNLLAFLKSTKVSPIYPPAYDRRRLQASAYTL